MQSCLESKYKTKLIIYLYILLQHVHPTVQVTVAK